MALLSSRELAPGIVPEGAGSQHFEAVEWRYNRLADWARTIREEGRQLNKDLVSIKSSRRFGTASPLRYPGGKAALAGFFADILARLQIPNARYIEPFAGGVGAGLALLRDDLVQDIVINDIDSAVFCFWNSVVNDTERFLEKLADVPLTLNEWRDQRDIYRAADERDPLALGFAFFYLNRTNRSGILNAGVIGGKSQSGTYRIDARFNRDELTKRVLAIGQLRHRIIVSDEDGRRVVERYATKPESFLYIDPPYVDMGGALYLNAFNYRDHEELAASINAVHEANWVLTYDTSNFIRKLYKDRYVREFELTYSAYRPGKAKELIVASAPVAQALKAHPISSAG